MVVLERGVTCVIPFFNGNEFLQEAIDSVTIPPGIPLEILVIVDLGSVDPIFSDVRECVRVLYNSGPFRGAGIARALGFKNASFRYVCFLDADDLWLPEKISVQISEMEERELAFSFGGWRHFGSRTSESEFGYYDKTPDMNSFLKKEFVIGCLTVCIDKSIIHHVPGNTLYRRNDYKMWFDVIRHCESAGLAWGPIRTCLGLHRVHSDSLTASKIGSAASQFKFYRACGFNVLYSVYYMYFYVIKTIGTR